MAIGIGTLITKRPSHSTVHTDHVYGGSAGKDMFADPDFVAI